MKKFLKQYKWPGLTKEIRMNINFTEFKKINNLPKTGEKIIVSEKKSISFKMSKDLFNEINNE